MTKKMKFYNVTLLFHSLIWNFCHTTDLNFTSDAASY